MHEDLDHREDGDDDQRCLAREGPLVDEPKRDRRQNQRQHDPDQVGFGCALDRNS